MRQIGVLAAPGIYALNNMITQIKEHNENCKLFREKIENIKEIKPGESSSNILIIQSELFNKDNINKFVKFMGDKGIKLRFFGN